ncbi:alpha/beta-tubulin-N-acetyltransferase 9 [Achroia grisella]|uniref:alpha/beta-tubulin-N-acetyltransferase 9 n=1 Tax=Achroia grisella TaxID=688607 RepID=UPI0027D3437D|nr:alpha/beta-tubulin-N-acetyltransferase 9 [Achroia grisella]
MKINNNTQVKGPNVTLVPYRKHHVPKYHMWMTSEELQKLTASEPLTLQQEYEMQKSWQEDEDKCTFIILEKSTSNDEIDTMIGDTNIFITDKINNIGEIEIMIAEITARGKKYGWEAVILMLLYGIKYINLRIYEAKISLHNLISIQMFKKLGFIEKSKSEVFQELTLEKVVTKDWIIWLENECKYTIDNYYN